MSGIRAVIAGLALAAPLAGRAAAENPAAPAEAAAVDRALAFLAREVPAWPAAHGCYSCHNNGDAARALYAARIAGRAVPADALAATQAWLGRPGEWEHNGGEGPFVDLRLARLQFALAQASAVAASEEIDPSARARAAELIAADQRDDGAWHVVEEGTIGSPATYGNALATVLAARVLAAADAGGYAEAIEASRAWLRSHEPKTIVDAAAHLLALGDHSGPADAARREACLDLIRRGEHPRGGWGPYVVSAAEPFDTALVLLALAPPQDETAGNLIARGRRYLAAAQLDDGSWAETTRPPGAVSYAQQISTTAWATLALIATERARAERP